MARDLPGCVAGSNGLEHWRGTVDPHVELRRAFAPINAASTDRVNNAASSWGDGKDIMQLLLGAFTTGVVPADLPHVKAILADCLGPDVKGSTNLALIAGTSVDGDVRRLAAGRRDGDRIQIQTTCWRVDDRGEIEAVERRIDIAWICAADVVAATPVPGDDRIVAIEAERCATFVIRRDDYARL